MDTAIGLHGLNQTLKRGFELLVLTVRKQVVQKGVRVIDSQLLNFFRCGGITSLGFLRLWQVQGLE